MKLPAYALLQMSDQDNERIERDMRNSVRWIMVHEGNGSSLKVKLIRDVRPSILYRGQTKIHDPCMPNISRGFPAEAYDILQLSSADRARLVLGLALNRWFHAEVQCHPMAVWAKTQNIAFDTTAIAQHYGIPTGYMDVSESFQVSAFFATCWFDRKANEWKPMIDGEGVMYRIDARAVQDRLWPICYQPFPRPTQQWGWVVELRLGEDFLLAPSLQNFTFQHDKKVGEEILKRFDGGAKIIALDPTAEVASQMCEGKEIPICFVDEVEADLAEESEAIPAELFKSIRRDLTALLDVNVVERANAGFNTNQLIKAQADWDACEPKFWAGVGIEFVRTRLTDSSPK